MAYGKDWELQRKPGYTRKAGANDDYRDERNNAKRHQLSYTLLYNSVQKEKTKWLYLSVRFFVLYL